MSNFVQGPRLSEKEMQSKLEEIRKNVSDKMGKWADRLQFSMHISPNIVRVEGEKWKENGKTWVIHNGVKKSVTFLQESRMPHWCPRCTKSMNHRFDRKFYYLRGHCFNCNVEIEGQMRMDGTFEAFEKRMVRENEKAFLRDKIQEHLDWMRTFKEPQIHFEDGRWEKLATINDFAPQFKALEDDVEFMLARLEVIHQEEEEEANANNNSD